MFGINRRIKNIRAWNRISKMPNAAAWMKIVEDVMKFATAVQQDQQPMLTKICAINMEVEELPTELDIVSLWASVGDLNPLTRLGQLKDQIKLLRETLSKLQQQVPENEENKNLHLNIRIILWCTE